MTPTTRNVTRTGGSRGQRHPAQPAASRSTQIALVRNEATAEAIVGDASTATTLGPHLELAVSTAPEIVVRKPAVGFKRAFDVVGAVIGLVIAAPLIALIAFAIKVESRGSVFFAHRRLGRNGRLFKCWKFRSMHEDAERRLQNDPALRRHYVSNHFKIPSHLDPRLTRLGRLLRRSSLDELPQLWNVLWGDMSLVGPRPIVPLESTHYGDELPLLLSVRPGLTGAWAVCGRSAVGYPHRATIELDYVRMWTLLTDMRILLRTPSAVFSQRGAH